jgi:hypothetical protein
MEDWDEYVARRERRDSDVWGEGGVHISACGENRGIWEYIQGIYQDWVVTEHHHLLLGVHS